MLVLRQSAIVIIGPLLTPPCAHRVPTVCPPFARRLLAVRSPWHGRLGEFTKTTSSAYLEQRHKVRPEFVATVLSALTNAIYSQNGENASAFNLLSEVAVIGAVPGVRTSVAGCVCDTGPSGDPDPLPDVVTPDLGWHAPPHTSLAWLKWFARLVYDPFHDELSKVHGLGVVPESLCPNPCAHVTFPATSGWSGRCWIAAPPPAAAKFGPTPRSRPSAAAPLPRRPRPPRPPRPP